MAPKHLGLDRPITRRDFFLGSAGLMGAAALGCREVQAPSSSSSPSATIELPGLDAFDVGEAWYGPGGVGDYAVSHGNTPELLRIAHRVRDGLYDEAVADAVESSETYDLVVVGGGLAGLGAAHHFRRLRPDGRVLVLDNHPIFGGEAKRNDFLVDGQVVSGPQGSNDFGVLPETGGPEDYFTALGMPRDFVYAEPSGAASGMRIPFDHYSYLHWKEAAFDVGHFLGGPGLLAGTSDDGWTRDLWKAGLWSDEESSAISRWRGASAEDHVEGKNELGPWLDTMTVKDYYERVLGLSSAVTRYVDPILASIIGLGCDAISAWWGWHFQLPGFRTESRYDGIDFHAFPGGNAGIARYFVKNLVPEALGGGRGLAEVIEGAFDFDALDREGADVRLRGSATVVRVENASNDRVAVTYILNERAYHLTAPAVVMASGGWMNRRVVRDLPDTHHEAYESFRHSSVLVANVALRNWRFLAKLGFGVAIWDEGFGFAANIRRPMQVSGEMPRFDPDAPTVMTFYVPLFTRGIPATNQGQAGRLELLQTPFAEYERRLREQMRMLFGDAGFDPAEDIAGIILNRWGHAYVNPEPGFQFGVGGKEPVHETLRRPFGGIAIGHSELRGHQNWTGAAAEGRRAVEALLDERA